MGFWCFFRGIFFFGRNFFSSQVCLARARTIKGTRGVPRITQSKCDYQTMKVLIIGENAELTTFI